MLNLGKRIRLARVFDKGSKRVVGIAMDHGISTPAEGGLARIKETIGAAVEAGADAVMINKGIVKYCFSEYAGYDTSIICKLGGATRTSKGRSVEIATPEEALYYGADMVSCGFIYNSAYDSETLALIGKLSRECEQLGIPFMVHAYARGELLAKEQHHNPKELKLAVRAAAEAGADIVKTSYPGTIDAFQEIMSVCPVPVVIAGGHSRLGDKDFLQGIKDAITAGASGVMAGTNVWMHKDPGGMVRALRKVIHENASAEEALRELRVNAGK
jgi:fructose-bisphosphate aldolase/2-amino-3,7-dideoxy-D-threo-hept-6-ulosonate synthase